MKISLNWLKDYIDLNDIPENELLERLTLSTCEVEGVKKLDEHIKNTVVGEIVSIENHPNADKLKICSVNVGMSAGENGNTNEILRQAQDDKRSYPLSTIHYPLTIVCGGTNLKEGSKVVVALPGATVKWHGQEGWIELKETEIRGVKSAGMICAAEELEIPWRHDESDGERPIMVLPDDAPVGQSIVEYFGLADTILDIDQKSITHRADLFSHVGLATEFGAIFNKKVDDKRYHKEPLQSASTQQSGQAQGDNNNRIDVRIEAKDAVKRYSALLIENIVVAPSPLWMQNRLRSIGIRSINNLVDVTNYVMWEFGMPLHAFDANKIGKGTKTVRFANKGETVISLDGIEHELNESMLVAIDGDGNAIDLPGIMGGQTSEVDDQTNAIWLQAAVFDRIVIRKMSLALAHRTDASSLYERGVDPNLTIGALMRTFELLKETCPDATLLQWFDEYPKPVEPREIVFEPTTVQKQLGAEISDNESKEMLERLGFGVVASKSAWTVRVPTHRKDVHGFQDICEEIGRVYGYDRIKPLEHVAPLRAPVVPQIIQSRETFRDVVSGLGFNEVITYVFWSERDAKWLSIRPETLVVVQNPISEDLKYLRTSLLPGMLKVVELNQGRFESCSVFEVGKVFERPTEERERFACLVSDSDSPELLFRKMVGIWETIVRVLKLPDGYVRGSIDLAKAFDASAWLSRSESVSLKIGDSIVGLIGLVKPKVLASYGVKRSVVSMELDAGVLTALRESRWNYRKLPQYPSVLRDVSLIVGADATYESVVGVLKKAQFLNHIELFDVFSGKGIPEGKKSLAFHLEFSDSDKTLTSKEVDESLELILQTLNNDLGAVLRS